MATGPTPNWARSSHIFFCVSGFDRRRAPHARAGGEYLEGVGANLDGAVDRRPASACGAEMHPDAPRFAWFRHAFETPSEETSAHNPSACVSSLCQKFLALLSG